MSELTQELIADSYYLSGVVSRGLDTVSAEQVSDGLKLLNRQLAMETAMPDHVPYYQEFEFDAVPGQEKYEIPGLIVAESLTFNIDQVRYQMREESSRKDYFGRARIDDIKTLPYQWHTERKNDGCDLYMYFVPEQAYPMKLWGKFNVAPVTLRQDLLVPFQGYYVEYLRYALAELICHHNNLSVPPDVKEKLSSYRRSISEVTRPDLTFEKLSAFSEDEFANYGQANIGKGWYPTG